MMKVKDADAWKQWKDANTDPYSAATVGLAEKWANLMEAQMAKGKSLEQIAEPTSDKAAEKFDITGFMYGAAVSILATTWEHGEQLRRWHNLDMQIGDEGERANEKGTVLNPALLSIREQP